MAPHLSHITQPHAANEFWYQIDHVSIHILEPDWPFVSGDDKVHGFVSPFPTATYNAFIKDTGGHEFWTSRQAERDKKKYACRPKPN